MGEYFGFICRSQLTVHTVHQAKRKPPPNPFIFFKPSTTITGQDDTVSIPKIAQDDQADYEGELVSPPLVYTCRAQADASAI